MIKNILSALIIMFTGIPMDDITITTDVFYYNHTSSGMENGKIVIDYYHIEIHHGTHIEMYKFKSAEYDEEEQAYVFITEDDKIILFEPDMHQLTVDTFVYFINSTIKTNW